MPTLAGDGNGSRTIVDSSWCIFIRVVSIDADGILILRDEFSSESSAGEDRKNIATEDFKLINNHYHLAA